MGVRARQLVYALIALAVAAAAVRNVYASFTPLGPYSCGGDWLCPFGDPVQSVLLWLTLGVPGTDGRAAESLRWLYAGAHGPALLALPLLALCVRRARAFLGTRSLAPPSQFAGLPVYLAVVGAALYLLGDRIWLLVPYPLLNPPRILGGFCMVLAFTGSEVTSLVASRGASSRAGAPDAAAPAPARARRRPVWGTIAVALPPILVLLLLLLAGAVPSSGGGWGLAPVALVLLAVMGGLAFGAMATVVAVLRRESWPVLQVAGFFLNFGLGLPLLWKALQLTHPA